MSRVAHRTMTGWPVWAPAMASQAATRNSASLRVGLSILYLHTKRALSKPGQSRPSHLFVALTSLEKQVPGDLSMHGAVAPYLTFFSPHWCARCFRRARGGFVVPGDHLQPETRFIPWSLSGLENTCPGN